MVFPKIGAAVPGPATDNRRSVGRVKRFWRGMGVNAPLSGRRSGGEQRLHGLGNVPGEYRRHCIAELPLGLAQLRIENVVVGEAL